VNKPSITQVIGERLELRKIGKEFMGHCPFHADKTPSFAVNEEKQVFFCHGCHVSGDVIDFVMKLDRVSFPDACAALGIARDVNAPAPDPVRQSALMLTQWLNEQASKAISLLREIDDRLRLANELEWRDEAQILRRQGVILSMLAEDLQNPAFVLELWDCRNSVEFLTQDAEMPAAEEFPRLTAEYMARLREYVRPLDA
jgi:hypothetical protein